MSLLDRWRRFVGADEQRYSFAEWEHDLMTFMGTQYLLGVSTSMEATREQIAPGYAGTVSYTYAGNPVVFACMAVRRRVFTEARVAYQRLRKGRPAELWSDPSLDVYEHPWPGGTTGDLLGKSLLYADTAGNAFVHRVNARRLQVLRPDWVTIISGLRNDGEADGWDIGAEVLGYGYKPGGPGSKKPLKILGPDTVAHFAPEPDPLAPFRGMSWLTPVIREVQADSSATRHKLAFFENAATPNMVVKADPSLTPEAFKEWVKLFEEGHAGLAKAYKTIFLGGGADATVVGANLRQLDFKTTQGAGESRIAAAAGVPPVLVGLSEGLQAATYSNYGQARRAFGDEWARPTWRNFVGSLEQITRPPSGSRLWYDDRDVPFLQEDQKDAADILQIQAATMRQLIDGGFEPDRVVDAVTSGDLTQLKHTGLLSVQLTPPGEGTIDQAPAETEPSTNGQVPDAVAP